MSLARYFVFQRHGDWMITLDGARLGRHSSLPAALASAIIMADLMGSMHHEADVMVEREEGLSIAWTYGVDTMPGKSMESAETQAA